MKSAIDHFVTSELRLPSRQSLMFPQIALFDTCVYFAYVKPFTVEIIFVNISSLVQINFPRNIQFSAIKQQQSGGRNSGETTQNSSSQEAGTQRKQHKTAAVRRQELRGNNTKPFFLFILYNDQPNAQLFHKLSHSFMFRHYRIILRESVINILLSYTSISTAAVGNTIYD